MHAKWTDDSAREMLRRCNSRKHSASSEKRNASNFAKREFRICDKVRIKFVDFVHMSVVLKLFSLLIKENKAATILERLAFHAFHRDKGLSAAWWLEEVQFE